MKGKVILVTGGSRGIGKGIAEVLVESGATVYITGRKHAEKSEYPSVKETAYELNKMKKGKCVPIVCDHKNDIETQKVFDVIRDSEKRLDVLVNNAFGGLDIKQSLLSSDFWEQNPSEDWEKIIDVALRTAYILTCMATKIMIPQKSGLIINISSFGSMMSAFCPLYGMQKEAIDRMTVETGRILKSKNITVLSLWPGMVRTEAMLKMIEANEYKRVESVKKLTESTTLTGKAVLALARDPSIISKTAKIHVVAELANQYGFKDVDGKDPVSGFSIKYLLSFFYPSIAYFVPRCILIPKFLFEWYYSKF